MIIEYFNSLSKHELNLLEKFIRSPWFNTSDPLKRFFYYLKKKYPDVSKEDLNRMLISGHVYYGKIASEDNIRKLISDLCMLIERFFVICDLENNKLKNSVALITALKNRKLSDNRGNMIRDIEKLFKEEQGKNSDYYYESILFSEGQYEYGFYKRFSKNTFLLKKISNINYFFLYNLLTTYPVFLINNYKKKELLNNKDHFFSEVISFVKNNYRALAPEHPGIIIRYFLTMMFYSFDDEYYNTLTSFFKRSAKKLHVDDVTYYHMCVELYFHKKIQLGIGNELSNRKKLFSFDRSMYIKDGYFKVYSDQGNYLNSYKIFYTVKNALSIGRIRWAEEFLELQKHVFQPNEREIAYSISLAIINFFKGEYDRALDLLNKIPLGEWRYYIEVKMLMMMIWLELNDRDKFNNESRNMDKFLLRNNKIFSDARSLVSGFSHYTKQIFKLQEMKNTKGHNRKKQAAFITAARKLKTSLSANKKDFDYKFWIKRKLDKID